MARVLSGVKPTGDLHIGGYLGAFRSWAEAQHRDDCFYFVADLHALTVDHEPEQLRERTIRTAALLLAIGLDPTICTLFVQSQVPEHTQLGWLLECTATMGELRRMTQFKEKAGSRDSVRAGLFTYPALMAADVLLYDADAVPVGDDQRQHLELTRNLAQRFNSRYGDVFVLPKAAVGQSGTRVMDLQDPTRKMSKSETSPLGTIDLLDPPEAVARKVSRSVTDSESEVLYDPEHKPGVSNLLDILAASRGCKPEELVGDYDRYSSLKQAVTEALVDLLTPIQQRYTELADDPGEMSKILRLGSSKAREVASATLERAQSAVGLLPASALPR